MVVMIREHQLLILWLVPVMVIGSAQLYISFENYCFSSLPFTLAAKMNKLKSLKVAQVKDEMDDDEEDGCDVVW